MIYKVTKRYQHGSETQVGTFKTFVAATEFIQDQLQNDADHKVIATYHLYEGMDLLEKFDQSKRVEKKNATQGQEAGSQQGGSGQRSGPSPLSTRPQPKGMPQSWGHADEPKKEGDK